MRSVFLSVFALLAVGHAGLLAAQDFSKLSEAEKRQVNDWMAERAERMVSAHKLESELDQAWADTKHSTPEIAALRAKYRDLLQQLSNARLELQKKVGELPAVQDKQKQLDAAKASLKELSKKIAEKTGGAR